MRQYELSQIVEPLRKPIYLLTRSALRWSDDSVAKWLRVLMDACDETHDRAMAWISRYER